MKDLVADLPTDLARVSIVDLAEGKVLLRVTRKARDPGKSAAASLYRDQLEGCDLGLAVRTLAE